MSTNIREIRQGEIYKHFKNKLYQITAIAFHSETGEKMVVYQALYGDFKVYVRPYSMFISEVDPDKYPNAAQKYRFEKYIPENMAEASVEISADTPSCDNCNNADIGLKAESEVSDQAQIQAEPANNNADKAEEESEASPLLLKFLDCDTFAEKLDLFTSFKGKADDNLLNAIAVSLDIAVEKEDLMEKYDEIRNCLITFERFEDTRMR